MRHAIDRVQWENERTGVFAGRLNGRIIGRVVGELREWEWAAYRNGSTHDCGKVNSFDAACDAVETSTRAQLYAYRGGE